MVLALNLWWWTRSKSCMTLTNQHGGIKLIIASVGQRYSFILNANKPVDNYWVRSVPNIGNNSFTGGINSAILRYVGAPDADPTTENTTSTQPLLETALHPLVPVPMPGTPEVGGADVSINLNIALDLTALRYTLNNVVCVLPQLL